MDGAFMGLTSCGRVTITDTLASRNGPGLSSGRSDVRREGVFQGISAAVEQGVVGRGQVAAEAPRAAVVDARPVTVSALRAQVVDAPNRDRAS